MRSGLLTVKLTVQVAEQLLTEDVELRVKLLTGRTVLAGDAVSTGHHTGTRSNMPLVHPVGRLVPVDDLVTLDQHTELTHRRASWLQSHPPAPMGSSPGCAGASPRACKQAGVRCPHPSEWASSIEPAACGGQHEEP